MPATSAVFRIESIGGRFVAVVRTAVVMSVSLSFVRSGLSRLGAGRPGRVGVDLRHGDQWQSGVAHLLEQAMERRLIGYAATDDGDALALVAEAQAVKPGSPSAIQVSLEADLVAAVLVTVTVDAFRSAHLLPSAGPATRCRRHWNIAADMGSAYPHVWGTDVMNLRSTRDRLFRTRDRGSRYRRPRRDRRSSSSARVTAARRL